MSDTTSNDAPDPEGSDPTTSWQEREIFAALRRLANARSQLAQLEQQFADARTVPDPDEVERLLADRAEMVRLGAKAKSRFGGSAARARIAELERSQARRLTALGFATFEAFEVWQAEPVPVVDQALLDFARREVRDAETAWEDIRSLELPDREPQAFDENDSIDDAEDVDDIPDPIPFERPAAS